VERIVARLTSLLLILVTFLAACSPAPPARGRFPNSDWFETDVLLGVGESGQPLATITISVPFRRLVFYRAPDGYRAPYILRAILRSADQSLQMREWTGEAWAEDYAGTRGGLALQRTVTMELDRDTQRSPSTHLELQILVDGTSRLGVAEVPIEMGRFSRGGLVLGELALYRLRDRDDQLPTEVEVLDSALPDPDRFVRRNSTSFDYATGSPWLLTRVFDLRAEPGSSEFKVRVLVYHEGASDPHWQQVLTVGRVGYETSIFLALPDEAFLFGTNRIEVRAAGADAVATTMANLGLDLTDGPSWKANLKQIEVLANEDEFAEMEDAPEGERARVWAEFWERRDPDPAEPGNPRLDVHYDRVAYARAFLRDGFEDGALSDRGRIWILHGRPDSIDNSSPGFENYGSYEVWRYRDLELAYYFRDVDGLGRYRLVWQEGV
jgi:GWxTD domain-containing protein